MRILFLTDDKYLYRKAELELNGKAEITADSHHPFDLAIVDTRTRSAENHPQALTISDKDGNGDFKLPLKRGELLSIIGMKRRSKRLSLLPNTKSALLDGVTIKLTSHEYSLLSILISGGGEFIPRERISKEVWEDAGDGLINIYVHYLREKLETNDEKIIISSRKLGYKINKIYLEV